MKSPKIGIVGLGYVGLPLALAFSEKFPGTVGFDLNVPKVGMIVAGKDPTDEGFDERIRRSSLKVSTDESILKGCTFIVVAVPTPIDVDKKPDLTPVVKASETVGRVIHGGETIVFESTVYPGVTEDICGPIIAKVSGLKVNVDFKLGYSPERVNPGDKEHPLEKIKKVVSGEDAQTLDLVASVYGSIIEVGVHRAPSIKVAEAAKVIENTQRDLNIALMNELAIIFDKMGISTRDVLDAAATKWNFLRFTPGLVGGHCIGVDPYYLTTKAEQLGYHPEVILAGRRINDNMGRWVAQRLVKTMVTLGIQPKGARVGVLGVTFKEDVSDVRNSRVPDIIAELREFGVTALVHDALASPHHVKDEYGISLSPWSELHDLDAMVVAVSHRHYREMPMVELCKPLKDGAVLADIKAALKREQVPANLHYWAL